MAEMLKLIFLAELQSSILMYIDVGSKEITANFVIADRNVFLISIYDKSEKENLTDKELDELLKYLPK